MTRRADRPAPPRPPAAAEDARAARSGATAYFLLAALAVAAVGVVLLRGTPAAALFFVVLTVLAAGLSGIALYRTLAPLAGPVDDSTMLVGGRTRAALERDKMLTLRSIKELEFDRAMGKVSESDFNEMRDRLRDRALRLLRQLEGVGLYRQLIERELASRLAEDPAPAAPAASGACVECGTVNDTDARFCKMCGHTLAGAGA